MDIYVCSRATKFRHLIGMQAKMSSSQGNLTQGDPNLVFEWLISAVPGHLNSGPSWYRSKWSELLHRSRHFVETVVCHSITFLEFEWLDAIVSEQLQTIWLLVQEWSDHTYRSSKKLPSYSRNSVSLTIIWLQYLCMSRFWISTAPD